MRVVVLHPCSVTSLKFVGLAIRKIWRTMCAALMGLVTLIFDLLTLKLVGYASRINWWVGPNRRSEYGHTI